MTAICFLTVVSFLIYEVVCGSFGVKPGEEFKDHIGKHTFHTLLYFDDLLTGIGEILFPVGGDLFQVAAAAAALVGCPYLLLAPPRQIRGRPQIKIAGILAIILAVQVAGLLGILHIREFMPIPRNYVEERYIWHVPLALLGSFAVVLTHLPAGVGRKAVPPLLFCVASALQVAATGVHGVQNSLNAAMSRDIPFFDRKFGFPTGPWHVPKSHTIHPDYLYRTPARLPDGRIIRSPRGPFLWHQNDAADGFWTPYYDRGTYDQEYWKWLEPAPATREE